MCMHTCVCKCVGCLLQSLYTVFGTGSLSGEPTVHQFGKNSWAGPPRARPAPPKSAGITGMHHCSWLFTLCGFWGSELRPSCLCNSLFPDLVISLGPSDHSSTVTKGRNVEYSVGSKLILLISFSQRDGLFSHYILFRKGFSFTQFRYSSVTKIK